MKEKNLNIWKNMRSAIDWFKHYNTNTNSAFIPLDIVDFYLSITNTILEQALQFASKVTSISSDEIEIIMHAKKSLLFTKDDVWIKKTGTSDVAMGSFDGAETCELIACWHLNDIQEQFGQCFSLYRNDGMGIINCNQKETENIKKGICRTFKKYGFKIMIEVNKQVINFLDTTLD